MRPGRERWSRSRSRFIIVTAAAANHEPGPPRPMGGTPAMRTLRPPRRLGALVSSAALIATTSWSCSHAAADPLAPVFDDAFWRRWGDGQAELAGYDLVQPRYGQKREGVALTIFVTETFSNALRVKSDPGKHPESDEFPVMKLNLVEDFPTGIYDYNLMTSTFVALKAVNGRSAGSTTKVSFSSQEWCGNVYAQALFDAASVRHESHSYFDGEADRQETLPYPEAGLAEDALLP